MAFSGFMATGGFNENGKLSGRVNPSEAERKLQSVLDKLLLYHFIHGHTSCWHLLLKNQQESGPEKIICSILFEKMGLNEKCSVGEVHTTPLMTERNKNSLEFQPAKGGMPRLYQRKTLRNLDANKLISTWDAKILPLPLCSGAVNTIKV